MEPKIQDIALRIRSLRKILEIPEEEMAQLTDVSLEDYQQYEKGERDFSFTFLYKCANGLGVDIVELLTGENPKLSLYSIVRKGEGLPIRRREGFHYMHLNYRMKNKKAETFLVTAPYVEEEQNRPIKYSTHEGHEFDYVLEGTLRMQIEGNMEILHAGDAIYYDSSQRHGMIATDGEDCTFLAIILGE